MEKVQVSLITRLSEETLNVPSKIKTEDDLLAATDVILKVRKLFTEIDEKRKARTAPANETIKLINEDYKKFLIPLKEMEDRLRTNIEEFVNAKIQKDLTKLEDMRKETGDKSLMIPIGFQNLPSPSGEVRFRRGYAIKVTDEKKVPKDYWTVDTKKIQQMVDAAEGEIKIPGVEIITVSTTALYVG